MAAIEEERADGSTGCGSSTGGSAARGRRPSTATATRRHGEDWLPFLERGGPAIAIDMPGWGRSDRPDPDRFDYSMYGLSAFLERCLDELGDRPSASSSSTTGAALALIGAQRRPELVESLVVDQRGAAAARLPLALGRPDLAPPPGSASSLNATTTSASHGAADAPGPRRPRADAAGVRRHDLGPLGRGHPAAPPSPSTATPTPTASPHAGRDLGRLDLPRAGRLGRARPLPADAASREAFADALPESELRSSPAPATGPGSTTPT